MVHIGPTRYPFDEALGDRYTWLPQRTPPRFAKLLAAANLLVSFNFSATTIVSAISMGLPVVLGINSHAGKNADEVGAQLAEPPTPAVRAWLARAVPLPQFRVWPLGLYRFLAPLARANPYTSAVETVEILEQNAFVAAMEKLLFDDAARARLGDSQRAYRKEVEALPRAADSVQSYVGG